MVIFDANFVDTCMCLDLVPSYNSPACIRGLSRFYRWRGTLSSLLSNNGTNFILEETQQFICLRNIIWNLIWPAMPWWGVVYVIIMRCVKSFLKKTLRRKTVTYKQLQTILRKIELALNNGPLTFTYENKSNAVLKLNHLLHRRGLNLQEIQSKEDSADINGGKTSICWNFVSLISRKLKTN